MILFYAEAQRHVKSCADQPCQWIMPSSVDAIPFSRIHDLDFSTPKPILLPTKERWFDGGEMVCCDVENCPLGKWFHLSCLRLRKAPRTKKWYCPDC